MGFKKLEKIHLTGSFFEGDKDDEGLQKMIDYLKLVDKIPATYKMSRILSLRLTSYQKGFLSIVDNANDKKTYIVSNKTNKVTKADFNAFCFAAAQILSNQSYLSGDKTGGGVTTYVIDGKVIGHIVASINSLCRLGYGTDTPTAKQKKAMETVIRTLNNYELKVIYANGSEELITLCKIMHGKKPRPNSSYTYILALCADFCENITNNYAELPQDMTKKMSEALKRMNKNLTGEHFDIMRLLFIHDRNKTLHRNIETIIEELGLVEAYKNKAQRTENKLIELFDFAVNVGIITKYDIEYTTVRKRKSISKVAFTLNPDFTKKNKTIPAASGKDNIECLKEDSGEDDIECLKYTDYEEIKE